MGELEQKLIKKAMQKHKKIFPCARRGNFDACFTKEDDRILFWYNTTDRSTHVISAKVIRSGNKRVVKRKTTAVAAAK
jgi:hypothetical protein